MNRNFENRKPTKVCAKGKENQMIIKALNMYGRVPEQYELLEEIERLNNMIERLNNQLQQKDNIIKEVREYITSYESIETIQQFDHNKNNEDLDYSTIDEMTRRYMMVHDKILKILDK